MKNKKEEEEIDYNHDLAAEYILDNISDALFEKLSHDDILKLLKLEDAFIEEEYQRNEKRKPFIAFELVGIKQDDINYYVRMNAIKHNIILNEEEIEDIMYREMEYMREIGMMGEMEDAYGLN